MPFDDTPSFSGVLRASVMDCALTWKLKKRKTKIVTKELLRIFIFKNCGGEIKLSGYKSTISIVTGRWGQKDITAGSRRSYSI